MKVMKRANLSIFKAIFIHLNLFKMKKMIFTLVLLGYLLSLLHARRKSLLHRLIPNWNLNYVCLMRRNKKQLYLNKEKTIG